MKFLLYLLMMSLCYDAISQTYEFKYGAGLNECDRFGQISGTVSPVVKGWLFTVENELANGDKVIFINDFKNYTSALKQAYFDAGAGSVRSIYFLLTKTEFEKIAGEVEGRFTFGTVLLPLKIRFSERDRKGDIIRSFDFGPEINVGLSLGFRLNRRKSPFESHLIGSIGVSSIPVDSETTGGFITEKTNASGFTPSIGHILTFPKSGLQLITLIGIDYLSRDLGQKWEYKGWPWLGVGIGFSVFKFGDKGSNP